MSLCCAGHCSNSSQHFVFKRYPADPQTQQAWKRNFNKTNYNFTRNSYLCEVHFDQDQWVSQEKKRLKKDAVPTLFCRCPPVSRPALQTITNSQDHSYLSPARTPAKSKSRRKANEENSQTQAVQTGKKRGRPSKESLTSHLELCPFKKRVVTVRDHDYSTLEAGLADTSVCSINSEDVLSSTVIESDLALSPSLPAVQPSLSVKSGTNVLPSAASDNGLALSFSLPFEQPSPLPDEQPSLSVQNCADHSFNCDSSANLNLLAALALEREPVLVTPASSSLKEIDKENDNDLKKENERLRYALRLARQDRDLYKSQLARLQKKFNNLSLNSSARFGSDQIDALSRGGNMRGVKWSKETILKALRIHFASGTAGYEFTSEIQMPLPSVRVLQERLKHIKFSPGLLHEIFKVLPSKTETMLAVEREAMLGFDEMSIRQAKELDPSTNTFIGLCTLPGAKPKLTDDEKKGLNYDPVLIEKERTDRSLKALNEKATKASLFVMGGVAKRWKQTSAFHFTGNSVSGESVRDVVNDIIIKAYSCGITIRCAVSDMGNRNVWSAYGINVGPTTCSVKVPHPADPIQKKLYILPDPVHIFKNIVEMLRSNKEIYIAQDFVNQYQLPSNCVQLRHIKDLCRYQESMCWKLAPGLSEDRLKLNHFQKMKVGNATKVFNLRVADALTFLSTLPDGEVAMQTTAWFIRLVVRWFNIMTARSPALGLSKRNMSAYKSAISHLHLTIDVFQTMKAGKEWKPCQTGVKAVTTGILELSTLYLDELGFDFVLCGRFTTDIDENVFSLIRYRRPNPTGLQFKQRLKSCSVSHFMRHVSKSSYDHDDRTELLDLLKDEGRPIPPEVSSNVNNVVDEEEEVILACLDAQIALFSIKTIPENERDVFYRVCGYVLHKIREENSDFRDCSVCLQICKHTDPVPHRYGRLLRLTNFKDGALFEVSNDVFNVLVTVEEKIMAVEKSLLKLQRDLVKFLNEKVCSVPLPPNSPLLVKCHDIVQLIKLRYIKMRVKLMSEKPTESRPTKAASSQLSSLSMGSRYLAGKFKGTTQATSKK